MLTRRAPLKYVVTSLLVQALVALAPGGCSTLSSTPKPPLEQYAEVDFRKWNSGMYSDEYSGKYVRVDGRFMSSPADAVRQGASEVAFAVTPLTQEQMMASPGAVVVIAPVSMRDTLIQFKNNDPVRVYGRVWNETVTFGISRNPALSSLYIKPEKIEALKR